MKRKELESILGTLRGFQSPNVRLEQYTTGPQIAASMLFVAESQHEAFDGKVVGDLGCGTGCLAVGASLLGAEQVVGIEIDREALEVAVENVVELDLEESISFVQADVTRPFIAKDSVFDTVIMNPPFGTKNNRGADMLFVKEGIRLASESVYSLHKTATRDHVIKKAKEWGVKADVIANLRYDLPNTYKFHKTTSLDIEVDFVKFFDLEKNRVR